MNKPTIFKVSSFIKTFFFCIIFSHLQLASANTGGFALDPTISPCESLLEVLGSSEIQDKLAFVTAKLNKNQRASLIEASIEALNVIFLFHLHQGVLAEMEMNPQEFDAMMEALQAVVENYRLTHDGDMPSKKEVEEAISNTISPEAWDNIYFFFEMMTNSDVVGATKSGNTKGYRALSALATFGSPEHILLLYNRIKHPLQVEGTSGFDIHLFKFFYKKTDLGPVSSGHDILGYDVEFKPYHDFQLQARWAIRSIIKRHSRYQKNKYGTPTVILSLSEPLKIFLLEHPEVLELFQHSSFYDSLLALLKT